MIVTVPSSSDGIDYRIQFLSIPHSTALYTTPLLILQEERTHVEETEVLVEAEAGEERAQALEWRLQLARHILGGDVLVELCNDRTLNMVSVGSSALKEYLSVCVR